MLAIRLQRKGRSGHAQFRVIVQDSRFSPKSEKVVDYLGSYDPHSKQASIDKEKAEKFLSSGAQPSNRVAKILKSENIKLPAWVEIDSTKQGTLKNPEKLRKNQSAQPEPEAAPEAEQDSDADKKKADEPAEEVKTDEPAADGKPGTAKAEDGDEASDEPADKDDAKDEPKERQSEAGDKPEEETEEKPAGKDS